jgi:HSP20 family protein
MYQETSNEKGGFRMTSLMRYSEPFQSMWRVFDAPTFGSRFEVEESDDGYTLRADVPGIAKEDIDIEVSGDTLQVSGERRFERKREDSTLWSYQRSYGSFSRSFHMPGGNFDEVEARLDNGVLTIEVPKRAEVKPRKIPLAGLKDKVKGLFGKGETQSEA